MSLLACKERQKTILPVKTLQSIPNNVPKAARRNCQFYSKQALTTLLSKFFLRPSPTKQKRLHHHKENFGLCSHILFPFCRSVIPKFLTKKKKLKSFVKLTLVYNAFSTILLILIFFFFPQCRSIEFNLTFAYHMTGCSRKKWTKISNLNKETYSKYNSIIALLAQQNNLQDLKRVSN